MQLSLNKDSGYRGAGLELLTSRQLSVGDRIAIETDDGEISGVIMPRYETASDEYIALKLKSGYNTGIRISKIRSVSRMPDKDPEPVSADVSIKEDRDLPKVALISTGGTIASKIDYRTGAVTSQFTADDILTAIPELKKIADFKGRVISSILSENMDSESK